ncbi:hypothetical protein [Alkalihalobacillus sp. LMS39]|uniref:hypothetical protein n=1 Tax=Alkalihalobacillus sp. LMS39 TaxID=2924032 RepID=UPI001FB4231F|nr:hypothetical protein [Alkalihalobacillus sp. LMS39]UOE95109.1 hypothetical protein MM271_05640 [Alkalihalobacillus sp. LMS39]
MSNINWLDPSAWDKLKLSKSDSLKRFEELDVNNIEPKRLNKQGESELREALINAFNRVQNPLYMDKENPNLYDIDLHTGLALYDLLNNQFGFKERLAAQDDIWRFISLCIIPDYVYKRHGLKPGRFYEHPRRIWLKSLWWYIHLSWQGSYEETLRILESNTTDNVVQLVERTGTNGYRVSFARKLMAEFYNSYSDLPGTQRTSLFRRVLKLSTARTKLIEPSLVEGGIDSYVKGLFEYFVKSSEYAKQ